MKLTATLPIFAFIALVAAAPARAQVPSILNYQGRVTVGGTNLTTNAAQFKFALVNGDGTTVYWKNDGTTTTNEPQNAVTVAVVQGLYSALLGDTTLLNMAAIPGSAFTNQNVNLRVWFSAGGTNPFVQLSPDQRIGAAGYALRAAAADAVTATNVAGDLSVSGNLQVGGSIVSANGVVLSSGSLGGLRVGPEVFASDFFGDRGGVNIVGGYASNSIADGIYGATIGGGGGVTYGTLHTNAVSGNFGTVAGGAANIAGEGSAVGGGQGNSADSTSAFIGGGYYNVATAFYSVIGGGYYNSNSARSGLIGGGEQNASTANGAVVVGGYANTNAGPAAFIGSGEGNRIFSVSTNAVIGGGQANIATNTFAFVGGGYSNIVSGYNSAIVSGFGNKSDGSFSFLGGGYGNTNNGYAGALVGGERNLVAGMYATIAGGLANRVDSAFGAVGAGLSNRVGIQATNAVICGGAGNQALLQYATVTGGQRNAAEFDYTFIGGGSDNTAYMTYGAIGGGYNNRAGGLASFVGGGSANQATGQSSTIPGGFGNLASGYTSFAAGYQARATNALSFVWAGWDGGLTASTNDYSFTVRAPGGARFLTTTATNAFVGVILTNNSTSWASLSDSNSKTDFEPIKAREILAKLAAMPVTSWHYKHDLSRRYIGPMAQDFHASFGLGSDDKTISTLDADGVALAAIQGLVEELKVRDKTIEELKAKSAEVDVLKSELRALRDQVQSALPPAP